MNQISVLTISLYLGLAAAEGLKLSGKWPFAKIKLLSWCSIGILLHGYLLYQWIDAGTNTGQNLSIGNMFSFVTWLMALLICILAIKKPLESLMIFILPIASFSIGIVTLFPESSIFQTFQAVGNSSVERE